VPHHSQQQRTTVAILGTNTAVNSALSLLLQGAGYDTRRVERDLPGLANGLLEGVDLLLLAPGIGDGPREAIRRIQAPTSSSRDPSASLPTKLATSLGLCSLPPAASRFPVGIRPLRLA
jgi:hypothetical protein